MSGSAYKLNIGIHGGKNAKALHHGTILLDVDMTKMQRYLNPNKLKLISKGVDSVRSRVMNLKELNNDLTHTDIFNSIEKEFLDFYGKNQEYERKELEDENEVTNDIIKNYYKETNSWDWKYGLSPEFTNSIDWKFDWGLVDLSVSVEQGNL